MKVQGRWLGFSPGLQSLLAVAFLAAPSGCQRSSTTAPAVGNAPTTETEAGPTVSVTPVTSMAPAVVALFPDGQAYLSPDGANLGGGGSSLSVAAVGSSIQSIAAAGGGVVALRQDGAAFFSPDGLNLTGGGSTIASYAGSDPITSILSVGQGVDVVFASGKANFSPNGQALDGAGAVPLNNSTNPVLQILLFGKRGAVLARFGDNTVRYSPSNSNLASGPEISAALGGSGQIVNLVGTAGGVFSQTTNGAVYFTTYGTEVPDGTSTIQVEQWVRAPLDGSFGPRDSARGTTFAGKLFLFGGFRGYGGNAECQSNCSYYDLWSSTDATGITWNTSPSFATAAVPNPRDDPPSDFPDAYSTLIVWNGALLAIGSTVWSSPDGTHWTELEKPDGTPIAGPLGFPATEDSRAVILGSEVFYLQTDTGDVFEASDPTSGSWTYLAGPTSAGGVPSFQGRCGAAVFSAQGRLWVEGGGACDYSGLYDNIWSSADGVTWTESATPPAWPARMWPCVAVDATGTIWFTGGYAPTDWNNTDGIVPRYAKNLADVWYSSNGQSWQQYKADAGSGLPDDGLLEPRHAPMCYIETATGSNTLVVVAGKGGSNPDNNYADVLSSIRTLVLP